MTWSEYLAIAISLISVTIAILSFVKTRRIQRFDYAPRIQLSEESVLVGDVDREEGLVYQVNLENPGSKPLHIDSVCIDYGNQNNPPDRLKLHLEGEIYLSAGEMRSVSKRLSGEDIKSVMHRFNIDTCCFYLRVRVKNTEGRIIERSRVLAGLSQGGGVTFFVPRGDILL